MEKNKLGIAVLCILCLSMVSIVLPQANAAKPTPDINMTMTTDITNAQVGDTVTYTFEVTNTGKVTLFGVEVDGNLTGEATKQTESKRTNDKLESWETWVFTDTYTVQEGDPDPLVNTATATAYTRKGEALYATDTHKIYLYGTAGDVLPDVLTSPNQQSSGNWFGCSVAVGEGVIVVGAAYESVPIETSIYAAAGKPVEPPTKYYGAGRVYIYNATDGALLDTLSSPNPVDYGWFGYSVAVGEGVIVVGAPKETSAGTVALSGNVHVYDAATRVYIGTLTSPNPVSNGDGQGYGCSVAVNDGIIAVGSSWETDGGYTGAGKVYLYNVDDLTSLAFSPLTSDDPQEWGRFGTSVAVGEGVIVVGAAYEDVNTTHGAGRVYIYDTTGTYLDTVESLNPEFAGHFGFSVAVGDGLIAIGAFDETVGANDEAGRAYVYDLTTQTIEVTLESQVPEYRGSFGNSVAVGYGVIVVGAELETSGGYPYAGNAYVYSSDGVLQTTLTSLEPEQWGTFGWSVAVGETFTVVSAYDAVYIFE